MNIDEFVKEGLGKKLQQQSHTHTHTHTHTHAQIGNLIWLKKEKI